MSRKVNIFPTNNEIDLDNLVINGIVFGAELTDTQIIECLQQRAKVYQVFEDGTEIQLFLSNLKEDIYNQYQQEKEEAEKLKQEYTIFKEKEKAYLAEIEKLKKDLEDSDVAGMEALRDQIAEKEAKIVELNEQITELEQQISDKDKTIVEKQKSIDLLNDTITHKDTEIRDLTVTVGQTQAELNTTKETLANVSEQLSTATNNLGTVTGELNATKAELESTKSTLITTQEKLDTTKHSLEEAQNLNNTLSSNLDKVTKESEAKDATILEKDGTISTLNQSIVEKDANISKLTSDLEAANTEKSKIESQLTNLQVEHLELIEKSYTILESEDVITNLTDKTLTKLDKSPVTIPDEEKMNTYDISSSVKNNIVTFEGEVDEIPAKIKYLVKVEKTAKDTENDLVITDGTDRFLLMTLDTSKTHEVITKVLHNDDSDVVENVLVVMENKITKKAAE